MNITTPCEMLRVFIGYDERQPIAYQVAAASFALAALKQPISITPIKLETLPFKREGLTPFTFSRFLVPWMCNFKGRALFVDADVACLQDPWLLYEEAEDPTKAVWAVNTTPAFERAAVMLFNCAHPDNAVLTPEYLETANGLHQLRWTENVGWLQGKWNHLVGYSKPDPAPGIVHYTMGIPCWDETADCEHADLWWLVHKSMNSAQPWEKIMGNSVHNGKDDSGKVVPLYKATRNIKGEALDASPAA